jgi:hypothetical protein
VCYVGVSVFYSYVGVTFNSLSILVSAAYLETVGRGTGGWSNLYGLPQEGAVSPAHEERLLGKHPIAESACG